MNQMKYLCSLAIMAIILSSCGPTLSPFTQQLYENNNWTNSELKRIQFYLSNDIVLYRELTGGKSEIVGGEIKIVNGRKREEITFRRRTPGIFLFSPKSNRFAVSFEDNGDERYLIFGPSPKVSNRYVLLASDWNRRQGVVSYAGQKWAVDSSSAYSALMVDLERIQNNNINTRVAPGRRIDGR